ncbi:MAG: DUF805 domain-containing protein [Sedimentitalea sp.]|nr:DUF805 domain-containing protein [Sedimentitalea sp.]
MSFTEAVRTCFSKYVTFSGRARRSELWWFVLFVSVCGLILSVLDSALFGATASEAGSGEVAALSAIFSLATFLPSISVAVRRLHDLDRSGWWYWIVLIPLIGWIVLIVWYATRGTEGPNRFGPDPLDEGAGAGPSSIPKVPRG